MYQGRHEERAKFVEDNQAGKGQQSVPIAIAHYFCARWHFFGICFSALAPTLAEWDVLPIGRGVACAWGASFLWVVWQEAWLGEQAARSFSPWVTDYHGWQKGNWEKRTTQRWWLYVSLLPLAIPLCVGGGFALVGVPVLLLVKLTYRGADRLTTVASSLAERAKQGTFVHHVTDATSRSLEMLIGWLRSMDAFDMADGLAKSTPSTSDPATSETSLRLLAGGLACFWAMLGVSACVVYHAWAAAD